MRLVPGRQAHTHDLVFDDFGQGMNLTAMEYEHPKLGLVSASLLIKNMLVTPSGDLEKRPDASRIPYRDPSTGLTLTEPVLRKFLFPRAGRHIQHVIVTETRIFEYLPGRRTLNLAEILMEDGSRPFQRPITMADADTMSDQLFICSGENYMVGWDGLHPATYVSKDWDENYRKPSVCCRHLNHLVLSGFMDLLDSRAQSVIRVSKLDQPTILEDLYQEARTTDDQGPTALISLQSGRVVDQVEATSVPAMLVCKRNNTELMYGYDLANWSDIEMHPHTSGYGVVGPGAWCWGRGGNIYFLSMQGIHRQRGVQQPEFVSQAIAPMWGRKQSMTNAAFPQIDPRKAHLARLEADPENGRIYVLVGVN